MTDITPTLSSILVSVHSAKEVRMHSPDIVNTLDSFLKEAYEINKSISSLLDYLRVIRTPYLSTAPPPRQHRRPQSRYSSAIIGVPSLEAPAYLNDQQREAIDSETSAFLRDLNQNISSLSSAVDLQHETATQVLEKKYGRPNGILWRWAAGDGDTPDAGKSANQIEEEGRVRTTKVFRDGVLWYLGQRLKEAVTAQQEMVEIRLDRERQRQMSILYDRRNKDVRLSRDVETMVTGTDSYSSRDLRGHDEYNPALDASDRGRLEQEFSPEQLQLFEEENRGLFEHYNDQLTKVTEAEKSLVEISSLQQTLIGHLSVQGDMIGQLVEDASNTDENVRRGNQQLKKASERRSTARVVFLATAGLCSFLVAWDLIF